MSICDRNSLYLNIFLPNFPYGLYVKISDEASLLVLLTNQLMFTSLHLGRSSVANDSKNQKKVKCDGPMDGPMDGRTYGRTDKAGCRVA